MKKYIKNTRHFIEKRGHMLAFLMLALMITSWIGTYQESINEDIIQYACNTSTI